MFEEPIVWGETESLTTYYT